ncbi:type I-E CRISPR-associated protein Cas6/Cse3/CasE [Epidermidibacterium keratini]|uniref:Type I-E CRISPR-associated protein Cas6/Cse3/CasE n=2 Tax=Epidermidibacterium keratini TaxID=1891644 RepID=A0A7L4YTM5_9ACTN|nr:type I-E CRISPR-associated protein Cas6/Cse3/CasE [Epidermidibacterium keratini]
MYLTRMYLNPARRGTAFLLASPQRMHAAVLSSFPPDSDLVTDEGRVLWRVDRDGPKATLFVSSPVPPDLTHVVEQAGWPAADNGWQTADTSRFMSRLSDGQRWRFRLTANPTYLKKPDNQDDGPVRWKPTAHVTLGFQEAWLQEKSKRLGFQITNNSLDVPSLAIVNRKKISFDRRTDSGSHRVSLAMATYDGELEVTDRDELQYALGHGIGRAKGYGCGLMTLAAP